jgi:hypothetical protein
VSHGSRTVPFFPSAPAGHPARVARLTTFSVRERHTLLPQMALCGASPSQEQKGFTGGNVPISVPTSARMVGAMDAERPVEDWHPISTGRCHRYGVDAALA